MSKLFRSAKKTRSNDQPCLICIFMYKCSIEFSNNPCTYIFFKCLTLDNNSFIIYF